MFWSIVDFVNLSIQILPDFSRRKRIIALYSAFSNALQIIHSEKLYEMQHDGRTIYLEKVLNEWFKVIGYTPQDHEATKKIHIEDIEEPDKLFIHLDEEDQSVFIEDDDSDADLFLDNDNENEISYSFIIFIPETYSYDEYQVRALVDKYRYFGKKYAIQTYTL